MGGDLLCMAMELAAARFLGLSQGGFESTENGGVLLLLLS